jgi:hypothetical protein
MLNVKNFKNGLIAVTAACTIATGVYGLTAVTSAPASAQQTGPIAPIAPVQGNEKHPEIERAIRQLTAAQKSLSVARHDYQGHRQKALDLVNQALSEAQTCLTVSPD